MSNLQLENLSVAEKFDLLDALWESLEANELSLTIHKTVTQVRGQQGFQSRAAVRQLA